MCKDIFETRKHNNKLFLARVLLANNANGCYDPRYAWHTRLRFDSIRTQFLPREIQIGGQRAALRDRRVECAALAARVGECDLGLGCESEDG